MPIIECARCGEDNDLEGRAVGDTIEITCRRCGDVWLRDSERSCPTCGSRSLREFREPLIQKARGTAYSVVGERTIYLCETCDPDAIEKRSPAENVTQAPREDPWR